MGSGAEGIFLTKHPQLTAAPAPTKEAGEGEGWKGVGGGAPDPPLPVPPPLPKAVALFPSSFASSGLTEKLRNEWKGESSFSFHRELPQGPTKVHPPPSD